MTQGSLLRVALTGGIATGKSHILELFRERSVPTIDADRLAHDAVEPGQPALVAIRDRFGPQNFFANGSLDRKRLAATVFDNASARADLEAIVHPPVRQAITKWFSQLLNDGHTGFAVADIPLLFETRRNDEFDRVIVAACNPEDQVRRVIKRDAWSEAAARKRLAAQLPLQVKIAAADFVIRTDGSKNETASQVEKICKTLRAPV